MIKKTVQQRFAEKATEIIREDDRFLGLAVGGSWLTNDMDEFSDLDLVLVTNEKIRGDRAAMLHYAERFGKLLNGFTGEHVGEPRLLICLYDDPLLHVDLKFVTLHEFQVRIEDPYILLDKNGSLNKLLETSTASYPLPDYQWIEDRFWIWVHYVLLKIGRGENMEAADSLGFLRGVVLGPLLLVKNGRKARGVRKLEFELPPADLATLQATIAGLANASQLAALSTAIDLYRTLRTAVFNNFTHQSVTEDRVMNYFGFISGKLL